MRRDDPNRPKGANQYTVKRRLDALAAAAKAESATGGGDGSAAAAYQAELNKTTNKGAYVRAAIEAAQRDFSEDGATPAPAGTAKPKATKPKGKDRDAGSGLTAEKLARQQAGEGGQTQSKKKKKKQEDAKSTVSEDDRIYCICQQLYDPERMMIACDRCVYAPFSVGVGRPTRLTNGSRAVATIGITTTASGSTRTM